MGALKQIADRVLYIDMDVIKVPAPQLREMSKYAHATSRDLKKIDPHARCVGKKRVYETAEELEAACEQYFRDQETYVFDKYGHPVMDPETGQYMKTTKPLTLAGLGLAIGIPTTSLRRYQAIAESGTVPKEFADVVMRARQRIEQYAEMRGYDKDGNRGSEFVLRAGFGWQTHKEEREIMRLHTQDAVDQAKLDMQKEKHSAEMRAINAALDGENDSNITINIVRATKDE